MSVEETEIHKSRRDFHVKKEIHGWTFLRRMRIGAIQPNLHDGDGKGLQGLPDPYQKGRPKSGKQGI